VHALRPPAEAGTIVVVISGRIARADIEALCDRVRAWLTDGGTDIVVCDVRGVVDPDVVAVDALARMQLTAQRFGHCIRLRHASPELQGLLALTGLCDVVPLCEELRVQARGETEVGEQPGGVEKERDPGDPAI
jgi:hypothetical protein